MGTVCYLDTGNFDAKSIRAENLNQQRIDQLEASVLQIDIELHQLAEQVRARSQLRMRYVEELELRTERRG